MTEEKKDTAEYKADNEETEMDTAKEADAVMTDGEAAEDAEADQAEQSESEEDEQALRIKELEEKVAEGENKYLRALADFDNYKRRVALDRESSEKYKAQSIMTNLLPVLDNFERALSVGAKSEEAQSMMTGMEMIHRNLLDSLKNEGLTVIEAEDKEFDPNFHQAVMTGSDADKPSGVVLEELQKGYMLKDRVIRPSMVKVNE